MTHRNLPLILLLAGGLGLVFAMCFFSLAEPSKMVLSAPSSDAWLGTDALGRSFLLRLLHGTATTVKVSFLGATLSLVLGLGYAFLFTFTSRALQRFLARLLDILTSIPSLLWLLSLQVVLDFDISISAEPYLLALLLGLTAWMGFARVFRFEIERMKGEAYIEASRATGASWLRLTFFHMGRILLPVALATWLVRFPHFVFREAFLSFIGLGLSSPHTSLGLLISEGFEFMDVYPRFLLISVLTLVTLLLLVRLALMPKTRQISWLDV